MQLIVMFSTFTGHLFLCRQGDDACLLHGTCNRSPGLQVDVQQLLRNVETERWCLWYPTTYPAQSTGNEVHPIGTTFQRDVPARGYTAS